MSEEVTDQQFESWDPLEDDGKDKALYVTAQRREIRNILKSYVGYYDFLAEPIQNALDAVEKRASLNEDGYIPKILIDINLDEDSVAVIDNGYGMEAEEFKSFLRPNYSFKEPHTNRGNKGVGATYLAYGFNHLEAATKTNRFSISGILLRGRDWVEDKDGLVPSPKIENNPEPHPYFKSVDRGTAVKIKLGGEHTRPRTLQWVKAESANDWLALLRVHTPLGGIYLLGESAPKVEITVRVNRPGVETSETRLDAPQYLYPHLLVNQVADLRDVIAHQKKQASKGLPYSLPPKFKKQFGIWGEWTAEQIFDKSSDSPINPKLTKDEIEVVESLGVKIYIFLAYSVNLWDSITERYKLRRGERILKGGLQLATKNMPQGSLITIPLTNNIGFQNQAHVIVHFDNAEPDLGRKGFQPEHVDIAEKLAFSAVTAFRKRLDLLRPPGVGKLFDSELEMQEWIRKQEERLKTHPLSIKGEYLFSPTEELPIRSVPIVEQDVVALFNQMLSSGLVRGIELLSSSQYKQYDGLFRICMATPFEKYIYDQYKNPLGIYPEVFDGKESLNSPTKVLEYKYSLDGLIEEFHGDIKSIDEVSVAVVWEIGEAWSQNFSITSLLDPEQTHYRTIHGTTHIMNHLSTSKEALQIICLSDMINFLSDPENEIRRQKELYNDSDI